MTSSALSVCTDGDAAAPCVHMHAECNMELFRGEEGEKMLMLPKPSLLWLKIIHLLVTARVHLSIFNINILSVGQNKEICLNKL